MHRLFPLLLLIAGCRTVIEDTASPTTDADGDGFAADVDCDDADPNVNSGAPERCNGVDDDCDGEIDEGASDLQTFYVDNDGDGYGDDGTAVEACNAPPGHTSQGGDCDDNDLAINPAAAEPDCTDPIDYNCDGSTGYADVDADGFPACEDCDDDNAAVNPAAVETCDGVDEDCDGEIDEEAVDQITYFSDADGDAYGDALTETTGCALPEGAALVGDDCDDTNPSYNPGATEADCADPNDYNCDGSTGYADADADGFPACEDCNDVDAAVNPSGVEVCNAKDDDCDGRIDPSDAVDAPTWYADVDADGFGDASAPQIACARPEAHVTDNTDCDDADAGANPAGTEVCNGKDDDCDGEIDEGDAAPTTWYADLDNDGFGDNSKPTPACARLSGHVADNTDCDDADVDVNPAATEVCNGKDDDCNGQTDEGASAPATWYADGDSDGFGDAAVSQVACSRPTGFVADNKDCLDTDGEVNPSATEVCNGKDDDCNGQSDEGAAAPLTFYRDTDSDGFGNAAVSTIACARPSGYVADDTDCDDANNAVNPLATEVCNTLDDNCDTVIDLDATDRATWYADGDDDGFGNALVSVRACSRPSAHVADSRDCDDSVASINPDGVEVCNNKDDNCDGGVDVSAVDAPTWYADADADNFGDPDRRVRACARPTGHVADNTDCNDGNGAILPGAAEVCNSVDDNCDGVTDTDAVDREDWFADRDNDTYGNPAIKQVACVRPLGFVADDTDCVDTDNAVYPNAPEACNGKDNDCNGIVDDNAMVGWYRFNEGSGTTLRDSSGNNKNGSHNAVYDTGRAGNALRFDGSTRGVVDGLIWGANNADFTVSYWIHVPTASTGSWRSVLHHGNVDTERTSAHFLYPSSLDNAMVVSTTASWNDHIYPGPWAANAWVHLADVKKGNQHILYLNGVERNRNTIAPSVGFVAPTYIGDDPWYNGLVGRMDELRIYCHGQTAAEIFDDITADGGLP